MVAPVPGRWIGEDRQQGRFLTARRLRAAQSCRTNWRKQVASCEKVASYLVRNLSDSRAKAAKKISDEPTRRDSALRCSRPLWSFFAGLSQSPPTGRDNVPSGQK